VRVVFDGGDQSNRCQGTSPLRIRVNVGPIPGRRRGLNVFIEKNRGFERLVRFVVTRGAAICRRCLVVLSVVCISRRRGPTEVHPSRSSIVWVIPFLNGARPDINARAGRGTRGTDVKIGERVLGSRSLSRLGVLEVRDARGNEGHRSLGSSVMTKMNVGEGRSISACAGVAFTGL